jgi:hypothetical protein
MTTQEIILPNHDPYWLEQYGEKGEYVIRDSDGEILTTFDRQHHPMAYAIGWILGNSAGYRDGEKQGYGGAQSDMRKALGL